MRAFSNYDSVSEYSEVSFKLPVGLMKSKSSERKSRMVLITVVLCACCLIFLRVSIKASLKINLIPTARVSPIKQNIKVSCVSGIQMAESTLRATKKGLKLTLERIKKSNNLNIDFSKEWDGKALKGCKVGMIFQEQEYDYEGKQGMSTQPYGVITLEALKEGKFTLPKPKYLKGSSANSYADIPADDDLPF